jgi:HEAT repeat protein
MRAATLGQRRALSEAIAERETTGNLSTKQAASLAEAVAERELRTAAPAEAILRVREARPCAHELDGILAFRMQTHDAAGAEAALARIDGRGLDLADARAFVADGDSHWRAVGIRGLVRPEDRPSRLRALVDPDPLVRREAARAARDSADLRDLRALAEAARLDPEPIVRTEAVRALAALPPAAGDTVANVLRDLWTVGDEGLREDIALAWSSPSVWSAGGRDALRALVASEQGPAVIEAAAAILRHRDADSEVIEEAVWQFARTIAEGSRPARLAALAEAPLEHPELLRAVKAASEDDDGEVRLAALARLAAARDPSAAPALEVLASPGSPVASPARSALASAGDRRVQAWIEQDLSSPAPEDRLGAAVALAALGVPARAAPLLADTDPHVRLRVACTLVTAARVVR